MFKATSLIAPRRIKCYRFKCKTERDHPIVLCVLCFRIKDWTAVFVRLSFFGAWPHSIFWNTKLLSSRHERERERERKKERIYRTTLNDSNTKAKRGEKTLSFTWSPENGRVGRLPNCLLNVGRNEYVSSISSSWSNQWSRAYALLSSMFGRVSSLSLLLMSSPYWIVQGGKADSPGAHCSNCTSTKTLPRRLDN